MYTRTYCYVRKLWITKYIQHFVTYLKSRSKNVKLTEYLHKQCFSQHASYVYVLIKIMQVPTDSCCIPCCLLQSISILNVCASVCVCYVHTFMYILICHFKAPESYLLAGKNRILVITRVHCECCALDTVFTVYTRVYLSKVV